MWRLYTSKRPNDENHGSHGESNENDNGQRDGNGAYTKGL